MGIRGACLMWVSILVLSAPRWAEGAPLPHSTTDGFPGPSLELVVVLSAAALVVLVVAVINCATCCKEQVINFKEFEDNFEDELDFTPPAEDTPSARAPAEVYTLAVSPVALPCPPHLQPPRNTEDPVPSQVIRHNLSYLQEVGSGWFGKVLLSEMYTEPSVARVLVQELKASASGQDQSRFLQQGDPYRVLQHPNLLQCLGQCVEAIPFLLVFEFCELGDLRSYVARQKGDLAGEEKLQLQKMACEIAAGVAYLHKHNFLHSDLALRNCFLTADLTVKVGDYGTGPLVSKEEYITTEADTEVPLRWMAPELIGELHGGVIASEQTKPGNVWALGVTLWELFESGVRPYSNLSDMEVLVHVIKEQGVKLPRPRLDLPHSDRWYEVLQFCWLAPDKRTTAEEVHRLLTYLRLQAQKQSEEDFEQRWDTLKPNPPTKQATLSHSSFPILDRFSDEVLAREVDEVLTVTETSRGLSFEYVWEAAKHDHYNSASGGGLAMDSGFNYHNMFFPTQGYSPETRILPSQPEKGAEILPPPGVPGILPVFDAHEAATGNEYYIQLEEQEKCRDEENLVEISGGSEDGTTPGKQQFVVLRDIPLDESSTDVDFFHRSVDSKDSYLHESQAWSSSDQESPYHSNIFRESGSKMNDSSTWSKGFVEMPELNGRGVSVGDAGQMSESSSCLLADKPEETTLENQDIRRLLNSDKLTENFLFLKDKHLMKEDSLLSEEQESHHTGSRGTDSACNTGNNVTSEDATERLVSGLFEGPVQCGAASVSANEEHLNLSADITGFLGPFKSTETLVPLSSLVKAENCNNQLHRGHVTSTEDVPLHSSRSGMVVHSDSTSVSTEVTFSSVNGHHSTVSCEPTTEDLLCTGAKGCGLETRSGASREDEEPTEVKDLSEQSSLASSAAHISKTAGGSGLPSSSAKSTMEDIKNSLNIALSGLTQAADSNPGSLVSPENNDSSSFLTSDPCLDQISQDSLLDSTVSTPLSTTELSAETPDSSDSMDPQKLQPPQKAVDSGYETENLESPEWNCQPVTPNSMLQPGLPQIIVSEVEAEGVLQGRGTGDLVVLPPQSGAAPPASELLPGGSQACRDSAYFSDNEAELDKKYEDSAGNSTDATLWSTGTFGNVASVHHNVSGELVVDTELQGIITEGPVSQLRKEIPELILSTEEDWDRMMKVVIDGTKGELEVFPEPKVGLEEPFSIFEDPEEVERSSAPGSPPADRTVQAKLVHTGEGPKLKEPDIEGRYLGKLDSMDPPVVVEDDIEADEEDEEENSEDSDDDVLAYRLHSSDSDSEDDVQYPVPVVVMDTSDTHKLKSLLKNTIPSPTKSSLPDSYNASPIKKAISFFDDVTVYLFDQEIPTRELGSPALCSSNLAQFKSPASSGSFLARTLSEGSTDEEGGGFEWDDDFSSDSSFISKAAGSLGASRTSAGFFSPPTSQASPYAMSAADSDHGWASRFSISTASMALSLTHLTDSDTEQGGDSEDGEKD
ncbi:serine/threonine-protein kinase LMTK2 [Brienomyrus brachyistius]|uniref:serine/threonine-protein kinase LMTK2 n=1 Tax=Brienomyrus brachyistius TaxID=42636 RepID=UPI0020B43873|nr:serine/threonine-protein kinase LMTK2 [Brienomyrus brachyistius]